MAAATTRRRAHIVLPDDLLHEIDGRVGPRRRSEFIHEAIEEKLTQLRRVEAFERVVGSVADWQVSERGTRESNADRLGKLRDWERTDE